MKRYLCLGGALTASTFLTGAAALAQVSASDARDDLLKYIEASNLAVTYQESASGNGLTLNNLVLTIPELEQEGLLASVTFPSIAFTENGDGTVSISVSPVNQVSVSAGSEMNLEMMLAYSGFDMTASGTNDQTVYSYNMDSMSLTNTSFVVEGQPINGTLAISVTNSLGEYTQVNGDMMVFAGSSSAANMAVAANLDVPGEVAANFALSMENLSSEFVTKTQPGLDYEDPMAILMALQNGMAIGGVVSIGQTALNFGFEEGRDAGSFTMTSSGMDVGVNINKDEFAFVESLNDLMIVIEGFEIPFPQFFLQMGEATIGMQMPLSASTEPRNMAAEIAVRDLALQPEIWGMIDPTGAFPHDPITVAAAVSGGISLQHDLTSPEGAQAFAMAAETGIPPFTPHSLSLDELTLSGAGAGVDGTGSFTFPATGMPIAPGINMPVGSVTFNLEGVNGLLDTLIGMGLIPEQEAMGFRMMLGMFTVANGEDNLTSTIEINDQGHILANGQRIQ